MRPILSTLVLPVLGVLAMLVSAVLPAPAQAWGLYAHRKTAEVAQANVSPEVQAKIRRLLRAEALLGTHDCPLSSLEDASVWPDCVRRDYWRWGYTAAWHYRTAPICEAYNARENCPGGACVTGQIERAALAGRTPAEWGRESWAISRDFIYPTAFDREDVCSADLPGEAALTQEDIVRGVPIAKRRVQQAGLRIAELLESAFAPDPLPEQER